MIVAGLFLRGLNEEKESSKALLLLDAKSIMEISTRITASETIPRRNHDHRKKIHTHLRNLQKTH